MSGDPALPEGLRIDLAPEVRHGAPGVLAGGAPRRVVCLSPAGRRALADLRRGNGASAAARILGRRLLDAGLAHPRPAPRRASVDVTVVVPVRDRPRQLGRCLRSLRRSAPILVVDDGSRDTAALEAIAARHGARVARRATTGGPASARNTALALVGTELVAFMDSDCVASPGWIDALAGHLDDPVVAAVAPRVRPLVGLRETAVRRYLAACSPLDMGCHEAAVRPNTGVAWVPTAALLVRRDALNSESFDESLTIGEDVDMVWRLLGAGHRVRYDPSVTVRHEEPSTLRGLLVRSFRYGTSVGPLTARHPGRLSHLILSPWPALTAALLLCGRPGAAAVVGGQHSALLARRLGAFGLPRRLGPMWFAAAMLQTAFALSRYVGMFSLPAAVAAAWRLRVPRLAALVIAAPLIDWARRRAALDPLRWTLISLADSAAYGAGALWGCARARTVAPLLPVLASRRVTRVHG